MLHLDWACEVDLLEEQKKLQCELELETLGVDQVYRIMLDLAGLVPLV